MKKIIKNVFGLILMSFVFSACDKNELYIEGEGAIISKTIVVSNFSGMNLAGANDVIISQGKTLKVEALGHENIIDKIKTKVNNNIWDIEFERGSYRNYELTIFITLPKLTTAKISGAGDILINNFIEQSNLTLYISGSGNIDLNTFSDLEYLKANISGRGAINAKKIVTGLISSDINISGSGEFNCFNLLTQECAINIPGSGSCEVNVSSRLDVTINGSGTVYYKGYPSISSDMKPSGSIANAN